MRPEDLRKWLKREPFQPFRLTLTDGRTYDVVHPELAMVGRTSVTIGFPRSGDIEPIYERAVDISLLHIMQVEAVQTSSAPPTAS